MASSNVLNSTSGSTNSEVVSKLLECEIDESMVLEDSIDHGLLKNVEGMTMPVEKNDVVRRKGKDCTKTQRNKRNYTDD